MSKKKAKYTSINADINHIPLNIECYRHSDKQTDKHK